MGLILITGGAGFIGQNLALRLIAEGKKVRILDNFSNQVHSSHSLPKTLESNVDLVRADIRDRDTLQKALKGVECIIHLAAETGTGQSMYEIEKYFSVFGRSALIFAPSRDSRFEAASKSPLTKP